MYVRMKQLLIGSIILFEKNLLNYLSKKIKKNYAQTHLLPWTQNKLKYFRRKYRKHIKRPEIDTQSINTSQHSPQHKIN